MNLLHRGISSLILVGIFFAASKLGYNPPYFGYDPFTVSMILLATGFVSSIVVIGAIVVYRIRKKPSHSLQTATYEQSAQETKE